MSDYPTLGQTVLDTDDTRGLAEFYRQLLGLAYRPGDEPQPGEGEPDGPNRPDWLVLHRPDGSRALAFQRVDTLHRTTWPSPDVPMQMHLDIVVPDVKALERHRQRALDLGAQLRLDKHDDPEEPLYVLADPAGHPFCLFVD